MQMWDRNSGEVSGIPYPLAKWLHGTNTDLGDALALLLPGQELFLPDPPSHGFSFQNILVESHISCSVLCSELQVHTSHCLRNSIFWSSHNYLPWCVQSSWPIPLYLPSLSHSWFWLFTRDECLFTQCSSQELQSLSFSWLTSNQSLCHISCLLELSLYIMFSLHFPHPPCNCS